MPERKLLRIGAVSAIVGAILAIVFNILHPRNLGPPDMEALLRMIADSTIWVGDHIGIIIVILLFLGGLTALYRSITGEPGAAWARLGFVAVLLSSTLGVITFAIDGLAMKEVAAAWANAPAAEKAVTFLVAAGLEHVSFSLFSIWIFAFWGVTFILYGLAVALSDVYPRWLGWVALVVGTGGALVGLVQALQGPSVLVTTVLFVAVSILLTLWVLVMGVLMWRRAGAAA